MSHVSAYQALSKLSDNDLIKQYGSLVNKIAYHMIGRLPASVQVDDLIQAGMMGLLESSRKYDPTKGASFETYAGIRIRGSMLDDVRKNDWFPRSVYKNSRQISEAIKQVEMVKHSRARGAEVADKLGLELDEYHQLLMDTNSSQIFGFDDLGLSEDLAPFAEKNHEINPYDDLCRENFCKELVNSIDILPDREKLVLSLYYDDDLNLKEIGAILEVSESRVCQIHSQAMARIRSNVPEWKKK